MEWFRVEDLGSRGTLPRLRSAGSGKQTPRLSSLSGLLIMSPVCLLLRVDWVAVKELKLSYQ